MEHVVITKHAYEQYCSRVEDITHDELIKRVNEQYQAQEWTYNKRQFIHLGGVWWVKQQDGDKIIFVTCYGRSHIDVPKALTWAARHNDRLVFDYAD